MYSKKIHTPTSYTPYTPPIPPPPSLLYKPEHGYCSRGGKGRGVYL